GRAGSPATPRSRLQRPGRPSPAHLSGSESHSGTNGPRACHSSRTARGAKPPTIFVDSTDFVVLPKGDEATEEGRAVARPLLDCCPQMTQGFTTPPPARPH